MSMQFRWLLVPLFKMDSDKPVEVERRLQSRFYHGTHFKDGRRGEDEGWSEWADIPEVHEKCTCPRASRKA